MDDYIAAQLGPSLRRLRVDRKLTQEALAISAGVKTETVHRAETGKVVPDLITLERVLVALGSSLPDFFHRRRGSTDPLPADEEALLAGWRALDEERRQLVSRLVGLLVPPTSQRPNRQ